MYTVKELNQVSAYGWTTFHSEQFPTLEEAMGYVKRIIDHDIELECGSCDEMKIFDSNNKCLKTWAYCTDDIDAPCTWNEF